LAQKVLDRDSQWDNTGTSLSHGPPGKAVPLGQGNANRGADFEEHAAIVEFDAAVPREWAEGYAVLCIMPMHPDYTEERWQRLIDDSGRFLDSWAVQVAAMGWTAPEVFGVHPDAPDARIDLKGLVPCIDGADIVAVSADSVTIQTPSGSHQRIFRRTDEQSPGRVTVWEIGETA